MLTGRGLGVVLGDLAEMGFDARWCVLGAHHVGAPHKRDRIWVVATDSERVELRLQPRGECRQDRESATFPVHNGKTQQLANTAEIRLQGTEGLRKLGWEGSGFDSDCKRGGARQIDASIWWEVEPSVGRVADGMAHRVDRLKAIGNGQVASVAALAWHLMGPR